MAIVGQLIFREKSYDVLEIERVGFGLRTMRLTLATALPEKAQDKLAVLVNGTSREPVRVGYVRETQPLIVDASLVY